MNLSDKGRKYIGALGERIAEQYLRAHGFRCVARNVARKTGELDRVMRKDGVLHIIEVKTVLAEELPTERTERISYDPSMNLHEAKLRKVARTGEWYVLENDWEGEWQVDGVLVWVRSRDGKAKVRYLPQIL